MNKSTNGKTGFARGARRSLLAGTALVAVSIAIVAAPGSVSAQQWDGSSSTLWSDGTNWSGNAAPAAGGFVTVDGAGGANQPTLNVPSAALNFLEVTAGALTVDNKLTSTVVFVQGTGTMTINAATGSVTAGGLSVDGGTLINNGVINGSFTVNGGEANNAGAVNGPTSVFGGTLNLNAGTDLSNTEQLGVTGGTVNVNASETVGKFAAAIGGLINIANGQSLSAPVVEISKGATVNVGVGSTLSSSNTFSNGGSINVGDGGRIASATAVTNAAGGQINFNGAAGQAALFSTTNVISNAGAINVNGAGDVQINGDVTNSGKGSLLMKAASGDVAVIGNFNNNDSGTVDVQGGQLTVTKTFTNASKSPVGVNIGANGGVNAVDVVNNFGSTIVNAGTLASTNKIQNNGYLNNLGTVSGGVISTSVVENKGTINGGFDNKTGAILYTSGIVNQGLTNAGQVNASGQVNGPVINNREFNVQGSLTGDSTFTNNAKATLNVTGGSYSGLTTLTNAGNIIIDAKRTLSARTITNDVGGVISIGDGATLRGTGNTLNNNATINVAANGAINDAGNVNNNATGVINFNGAIGTAYLISGTKVIANAGAINVIAAGNVQINGDVTNSGKGSLLMKATSGDVAVIGAVANNDTSTINVQGGQLTITKSLTNASTAATGVNIASGAGINATDITNKLGSTIVNAGTLSSTNKIQNDGFLNNLATGVINGGVINTGLPGPTEGLKNAGTINGGLDNKAGGFAVTTGVVNQGVTNLGRVVASGQVNGPIVNSGKGLFETGAGGLVGNGTFTNNDTAVLTVNPGNFTGITTLTNNSTNLFGVGIQAGSTLFANSVVNSAGAFIKSNGTLTSQTPVLNSGSIFQSFLGTINGGINNKAGGFVSSDAGVINGGITNAGTVDVWGKVNGVVVNDNIFNVTGDLTGDSTFTNNTAGKLNVTGGNYTGLTTLTNTGTITIAANKTLEAGTINNNAGLIDVGAGATLKGTANTLNNNATINVATSGNVIDAGNINNLSKGVINFNGPGGTSTLSSGTNVISNAGQINVTSGSLNVTGNVTNSGTGLFKLTNTGGTVAVTGDVLNTGTSQLDIGATAKMTITGALTNQSTAAQGVIVRVGTSLSAGSISNAVGSTIFNAATITSGTPIQNAGTLNTNAGANSKIFGGLTNSGTTNAMGQVNGVIVNNGAGVFEVTGALTGDNTFTNNNTAQLRLTGGGANFTGITTLTNNSNGTGPANPGVFVDNTLTLGATTAIVNNGTFTSNGTVTSPLVSNTGTMKLSGTLNAATSFTNSNLVNLTGNLGGNLPTINNLAAGNIVLNGFTLGNNPGTLTNAGKITALGANNQITGNVINNNLISLRDGVNTTDALKIGGTLGGSGTLAVDANLARPTDAMGVRGDFVTVAGSSAGANVNVSINAVGTGAALTDPINIYKAAGGGAPNVTVNGASRINPFLQSGLVNYFLAESAPGSGLFQIQSTVNTGAAMGIASGLSGAMGALQSGFHQPVSAIVSKPENCGPDQLVGGMFIRVTGGSTDTTLNGSGALTDGTNGATARTSSSARFGGFQTGFDMGKCNVGNSGWDMHFGIMTGMVDVNMSSRTAVTNNNGLLAQGAATSLEIAVPFLGAYAFARNSGFTFEANLRRDFYRVGISSIAGNVYVPRFTKINGEGTSFNAQISYRVMLGDRFFVEPQAGYSYGVSSFGALNLFTGPLGAQTAVASVAFDDTKSSLGRVGFLAGTTLQITDKLYGAPFVQALLWREFGDPTNARTTLIANPALNPPQVFASQTERVGTFGQVGGGLQLRLLDSPWSGFVRGDYRFGDKIDGVALNVGVRGNFSTY